ncbi:LacI family DNA-binding transcriptional regulator [Devosia sp. D6-9]|nr:LacI family DNA-binding transcriptional regulator [Devosia sp. D6-9]
MSEKTAKLADVAKAAGVSQGTASNVFNRPDVVREEVREKVLAAAKKIGYGGPNPKGRLLRAGKVNAIGIGANEPLSYFFEDPFARTVMAAISEEAQARGAGIALVSAQSEEALAWNIQSALVDGFILFCLEGADKLVELSQERQLPFVAINPPDGYESMAAITIDNLAGARLAAEHLIELGHRRFAILGLPFNEKGSGRRKPVDVRAASYGDTRDRALGYYAVLAQSGIGEDEVPLIETRGDRKTVNEAMEQLFEAPEPPTALLCMSDLAAMLALEWLQAKGIRVPDEVSVIGFDGVPEGAMSNPPLTTIAQPLAEIGRKAVDMILGAAPPAGTERMPVRLLVRSSTGPAPRR